MSSRTRKLTLTAAMVMAGTLLYACQDTAGPGGSARVRVLLTDAPSEMLASAEVWISHVYLMPGEGENGQRVDLFKDAANPRHYDLLLLRDGVTADLTAATEVDAGRYSQLRLVVDSAFVTLADGYTFADGSLTRSLFVPSGAQTGIKVNLTRPIDAAAGETTEVVVDFDVDLNFVIQGNPNTPAGIMGILFTPMLVEKSRSN